ncbi:hypothetical protein Hanom_Chr10g00964251 [Helianthus anomalus]
MKVVRMLFGRHVRAEERVWWSTRRFPMAFPASFVDLFSIMWNSNHGMVFDKFFFTM